MLGFQTAKIVFFHKTKHLPVKNIHAKNTAQPSRKKEKYVILWCYCNNWN